MLSTYSTAAYFSTLSVFSSASALTQERDTSPGIMLFAYGRAANSAPVFYADGRYHYPISTH